MQSFAHENKIFAEALSLVLKLSWSLYCFAYWIKKEVNDSQQVSAQE
jgi:hypothetical protein